MGVQGLWELLAPVGRRVSVESLGSRRLAIDASIWIVQFMKAMRDDRGDMIRNAHLLGFFRRICKLLFLRIKPVFVFDGGTPALKRRTVIARRRQREQAQSKIRKTAEKLLLNHLRTRKLEEIAGGVGPHPSSAKSLPDRGTVEHDASALSEETGNLRKVLASDSGRMYSQGFNTAEAYGGNHNQESADALLAASLERGLEKDNENDRSQLQGARGQAGGHLLEKQQLDEEEDEDDEELVYLPAAQGKLDPAVLASLPPSMQLDLLVQMREQLVAENRQKFEKVAKAPATFSQLQIEAYLKTVAFRREINNVQKAAAGRGVGGVPSARIASETNREFIFSSSYQGDKLALTGASSGNPMLSTSKPPEPIAQPPASSFLSANYRSLQIGNGTESSELEEADGKPDSSVHTYVDTKGITRVSRIRGMGVRMTRDLQWNLYLMKDVEKRQALGSNDDDDVSAAERLVSQGDGEVFQRLMLGDNPHEPLSVKLFEQRDKAIYDVTDGSLETERSGGLKITIDKKALVECDSDDGDLFNKLVKESSGNDGVAMNSLLDVDEREQFSVVVKSNGLSQPSGLQISFDSKEVVDNEDIDLFKNLVGDETKESAELLEVRRNQASEALEEEEQEECEWEDAETQGRVSMISEPNLSSEMLAGKEDPLADNNLEGKKAMGEQESLQVHDISRDVFQTPVVTGKQPSISDDGVELAEQMTIAIQRSLEENVKSNRVFQLSAQAGRQAEKNFAPIQDVEAETPLAIQDNLADKVQAYRYQVSQRATCPIAVDNVYPLRDKDEQVLLVMQQILQENGQPDRVSQLQPYLHTPTAKHFSLAGDSDAEMALAIQQSLAEHDRSQALQAGGYLESEDTGVSDDSDTGNSDESEVEWEDGSGAVAVAGAEFTVSDPGVLLTEEDAELEEAIRRSLDDVGSWRMPVRVLPQLIIREPAEDNVKVGPINSPRVVSVTGEDQQSLAGVDKLQITDSEEARLARERARKGKAVAGESVLAPLAGVKKAVLQSGLDAEGGLPQEYAKGRNILENECRVGGTEVGKKPLGPLEVDARFFPSKDVSDVVTSTQNKPLNAEGKEDDSHLNVVMKRANGAEESGTDGCKRGKEATLDVENRNAVPLDNGITIEVQTCHTTDVGKEPPYVPGISRAGTAGATGELFAITQESTRRQDVQHGIEEGVALVGQQDSSENTLQLPVSDTTHICRSTSLTIRDPEVSRVAPVPRVADHAVQFVDQEAPVAGAMYVPSIQFDMDSISHLEEQIVVTGVANDEAISVEAKGDANGLTGDVTPMSRHPNISPKDILFNTDDMLKDAEEMDVEKERKDMLNHERELLVEREALAREEAELQAALEEEQEELRAGVENERELLMQEEIELREAQKKNERNAASVTGEMFAECQELLQMFGLPYIIAPMEAEAQCAYMDTMQIVDGVVTDDCDVFLFGGRNVYKNIFDDRKYVETYYMKDIETEMRLSRDKLIRMALLLGSDYTEGISGIGIVNAIEVVNAFDEDNGLREFKELVESPDLSLLGLQGKGYKKKGTRGKQNGAGEKDDVDGVTGVGIGDDVGNTGIKVPHQVFMENHRAVSKNWKIPESFPSDAVVAAYANPNVDKSTEPFTWGRPDLEALRKFCYERFSWPKDKADDLLLPVLKEYDRRETQLRMDAFYSFNQRFAKVRSARIQKALKGQSGHQLSSELMDIPSRQDGPPAKKPKKRKVKEADPVGDVNLELIVEEEGDPKMVKGRGRGRGLGKGTSRGRGRGRTSQMVDTAAVSFEGQPLEQNKAPDSQGLEETEVSEWNGRGRGRGRGNVRGRGKGRGRGRSSGCSIMEKDSSASQSSSEDGAMENPVKEGSSKRKADDQLLPLRRSNRARMQASYNEPGGSDDGASSPGSRGNDLPSRSFPMESADPKSADLDDLVIATDLTASKLLKPQLLIVKQEYPEISHDSRDVSQLTAAVVDTNGGGYCNSDTGKIAGSGSLQATPMHIEGDFISRDEEAGSAAVAENMEAPGYLFTGGGFCVADEEDVSPPLEDQNDSQTRESGVIEKNDSNMAFKDQIDSFHHIIDPLDISGTNIDEETTSRLGLRAMPLLRRKRPSNKP